MKEKLICLFYSLKRHIGAGYVLLNDGKVNAGYACIPMVFALISISFVNSKCKK